MGEYEVVEFIEPAFEEGGSFAGTLERVLGAYDTEGHAIAAGRSAWNAFRESGSSDVAWWIVRAPGESLARWIADAASPVERVLDLTTNQLVEVR